VSRIPLSIPVAPVLSTHGSMRCYHVYGWWLETFGSVVTCCYRWTYRL